MPKNRSVPGHFRMCRVLGHAWDYTTVKRVGGEFVQGLTCLRCETLRYIKVNTRTGEASGSRYSYPDGYLFHEGGALTPRERARLRLSEIRAHALPPSG